MANKKGTALMMVWADIPADKEDDFNAWYNEEHLKELVSVPGILNAARYEAVRSGPKHLACYELESPAVIDTDAFKDRPRTEWGSRVSPSIIGTNFINNIYEMIYPSSLNDNIAGADMAPALQIGRMDISPENEDEWNRWYSGVYVPNYEKVPGCIRGRRWKRGARSTQVRCGLRIRTRGHIRHIRVAGPAGHQPGQSADARPDDPRRGLARHLEEDLPAISRLRRNKAPLVAQAPSGRIISSSPSSRAPTHFSAKVGRPENSATRRSFPPIAST